MQFTIFALAAAASVASAQSTSSTVISVSSISTGVVASSSTTTTSTRTTTPPPDGFSPAPSSTVTAAPGSLDLGDECNPFAESSQCRAGIECWASNAGLIARCGNFNANCASDSQCAFNTCNNGLCNGLVLSSSTTSSSTRTTTPAPDGFSPAPSSTVTAAAGSLDLGAECNPFVEPSQCRAGIECWASNAGLIARCGNFNANCASDSQCAFNTCNNGLCNGLLVTTTASGLTTSTVVSNGTRPASSGPTLSATTVNAGGSLPPSLTGEVVESTGAASTLSVASGLLAVVFGAAAWAF